MNSEPETNAAWLEQVSLSLQQAPALNPRTVMRIPDRMRHMLSILSQEHKIESHKSTSQSISPFIRLNIETLLKGCLPRELTKKALKEFAKPKTKWARRASELWYLAHFVYARKDLEALIPDEENKISWVAFFFAEAMYDQDFDEFYAKIRNHLETTNFNLPPPLSFLAEEIRSTH